MSNDIRPELANLRTRLSRTLDSVRQGAAEKRHSVGYRTARENLIDLVDPDSLIEYGQLGIAAQRNRRDYEDLQINTAGDGVITGVATINRHQFGTDKSRVAVAVYDYSVLAGTQGYYHHKKLDRIFELAEEWKLPMIVYTEGGGGRPGDTDVTTQIAGLHLQSFHTWAGMSGLIPRIAINNGFCFAGNAVLFGCADITIATRTSWIGMAGPAMIEGGGLGVFEPTEIGPIEVQEKNGVVDIVADDEAEATEIAKRLLGLFQGSLKDWSCPDQGSLRDLVPENRRRTYPIRRVIETLADVDSFIELRRAYGPGMVTGFIRLEGRPIGLIANDGYHLGGAVDAESAEKGARFLQLCDAFGLPILTLTDTPGFMVGPDSDAQSAVRRMSRMFVTGATITVPMVSILLRKGYGLGAMAMTGGSFGAPVYMAAWPTGEIGGMGLEGAVLLGYKKELEAVEDETERRQLFDKLLAKMYEEGKATEAATHLEIDAVIDPVDTRDVVIKAFASAPSPKPSLNRRRTFIDTW
ncbi:MAG: carboxyl transferase domain-containing protein [Desulfatiglans sp.]|jgi:acetyl-CoA carboxylase carboxyltransferase component|nr:carboxyl transferase domain-containing protein [Desulfatiglans sp.]